MCVEYFPPMAVKNIMINEDSIALDYSISVILESLSISEIHANNIEVTTRLQSQDPEWHKILQDRITASLAGDIIRRRKDK